MSRTIVSILVLFLAVGVVAAFDVQAAIKKVDADKDMIYFSVDQKDRAAKVEAGAKILGADGMALEGGLKAKELRDGAVVTLSIEAVQETRAKDPSQVDLYQRGNESNPGLRRFAKVGKMAEA